MLNSDFYQDFFGKIFAQGMYFLIFKRSISLSSAMTELSELLSSNQKEEKIPTDNVEIGDIPKPDGNSNVDRHVSF